MEECHDEDVDPSEAGEGVVQYHVVVRGRCWGLCSNSIFDACHERLEEVTYRAV